MKRDKLISFALNFASFLVDKIEVKSIILFGSVAKDHFDEESDIDIFVETNKKNHGKIEKLTELYKKSKDYETFRLEGIKNELSIKCGVLEEWKELKRSIISNGIILYGKFQGKPEKLKHKLLFLLDIKNFKRAEKIKIWRKIYGYKQKVGKKTYISKGFAEKKLGRGVFLVSSENSKEVMDYLIKNKIGYSFSDIWVE